jgi:hypothetical protein
VACGRIESSCSCENLATSFDCIRTASWRVGGLSFMTTGTLREVVILNETLRKCV